MKMFCDGENGNENKLNNVKIIFKFLGIFLIIGLGVLFFHNMIMNKSKFMSKLQNDISDYNLEIEFKILFEELKSKNKKENEAEIKFVNDGEIFRQELIREIKYDERGNTKLFPNKSNLEIKIDNKKNLKRESEMRMLIENINEDIIENEIMKRNFVNGETDLDFIDI